MTYSQLCIPSLPIHSSFNMKHRFFFSSLSLQRTFQFFFITCLFVSRISSSNPHPLSSIDSMSIVLQHLIYFTSADEFFLSPPQPLCHQCSAVRVRVSFPTRALLNNETATKRVIVFYCGPSPFVSFSPFLQFSYPASPFRITENEEQVNKSAERRKMIHLMNRTFGSVRADFSKLVKCSVEEMLSSDVKIIVKCFSFISRVVWTQQASQVHYIRLHIQPHISVPVAARSKAWVCGCSLVGNAVSNPAGGMDVCLFCVLCTVRYRGLCIGLITRLEESY